MNTEILVHVTAPATVHHDKNYRAIARGVTDFVAATRTRVTDHVAGPTHQNSAVGKEGLHCVEVEASSTHTFAPPHTELHASETRKTGAGQIRKRKRDFRTDSICLPQSRVLESFPAFEKDQVNRYEIESAMSIGKLRKKHFHGIRTNVPHGSLHPDRVSPGFARPKTAPAATTSPLHILIPCTETQIRCRALSDSFSFGSRGTTVPNSQPTPSHRRTSSESTSLNKELSCTQAPPLPDTSKILGDATASLVRPGQSQDSFIPVSKQTIQDVVPAQPQKAKLSCLQVQGQSLDKTAQERHQHSTDSVLTCSQTSTATPSQQEKLAYLAQNQDKSDMAFQPRSSPINLISPSTSSISQMSNNLPPSSSPPQQSPFLGSQQTQVAVTVEAMKTLEWKTDSPTFTSPQSHFTTDLTPRLEDYGNCRPIRDNFLPIRVLRDVGILERGFWHISIVIAEWAEVEEWRRLDTVLRDGPVKAKYDYSPWTADEFLAFYNRLSNNIKSGHLGSVRLFRVPDEAKLSNTITDSFPVTLRLYSWGETLAHLYMAMRWLSESKIDYVPTTWVGSDGETVIAMSGERYRQKLPRLGSWVRKGDSGAQGRYGVAEAGS